ncbi:MAG: winged helix-turn-helix domain-containing protein [Thermomicrobiales bacterium]
MAGRIGDLLITRAAQSFVGREEELALLLRMLDEGKPPVWFIHAMAGTGKSRLLEAFAGRARRQGATVVTLDCRTIEPTAGAMLRAIAAVAGGEAATAEATADRVGAHGDRVVLVLDAYETVSCLDAWLREVFIPLLPTHMRVVMASRHSPETAWMTTAGWAGLFRSIPLEGLPDSDALELLRRAGLEGELALRLVRVSGGCPLALRLAVIIAGGRPDMPLDEATIGRLYEDLMAVYLADVKDTPTLNAMEAASVVRRATRPLLAAMLPEDEGQGAFDRLRRLSFVLRDTDGLTFHDTVQAAIATRLRANDPTRYREYRRAAWRHLRAEVRGVGTAELWRYTADMLFLLENPAVREAFFPTAAPRYTVETAKPADEPAIMAISERHDGPATREVVETWWRRAAETFRVVRDRGDDVVGSYPIFTADAVPAELMRDDPILHAWLSHLRREPVPRGQRVIFAPRGLTRETGEAPSPVQSAIWLEIKRMYMDLKPHLRRLYIAKRDLAAFDDAQRHLGFRRLPECDVIADGMRYHTLMLDFGPASVDGWLAGLVTAELGVEEDGILDQSARELVLDGERTTLTRLEFSLMQYLTQNEGKAVSRADLLANVWGYDYEGGSNVVDVAVRGLRQKMGDQASMIETVRGTGYRLRVGSR